MVALIVRATCHRRFRRDCGNVFEDGLAMSSVGKLVCTVVSLGRISFSVELSTGTTGDPSWCLL